MDSQSIMITCCSIGLNLIFLVKLMLQPQNREICFKLFRTYGDHHIQNNNNQNNNNSNNNPNNNIGV